MQIGRRSRSELKQYFVKNAIPTESNFAELIDGMLNQKEDGIARLPNDALSIEAAGDDTSQKKAIHFYNSFSDNDPVWVLSLNPRQDPAAANTARPGFSISDSAGNSRLFIERGTGNVGVGTVGPLQAKLQVAGTVRANRFTSDNTLVLNDYTTVNPPSNVYLYSAPDDRDAWIYLDSANTRSNWGIYHRQLNDAVKGLPGNSIGFIGSSKLQAYISLRDGSAHFAGGALIHSIGIGTQFHGPTTSPHETIQMNPAQDLRIWFGPNERVIFLNNGDIESKGSYIKIRGGGNEAAYLGGDGVGRDVQIGSTEKEVIKVIAWNKANRTTMDFQCNRALANDFIKPSDARLKENIEPLTGALDRVSRLRGVGFNWKNPPADEAQSRNLGLIAQEVRAVVPEAVTEGREGHLGISYSAITVLLLEAVKEQQKQLDELRGALKEPRAQRKKGQ
ncbi:MAG TPA: tail fiber domain-containing protein [Myxococcus sp.]|nr:tail fiber domain-containing protein [Myxococcus sp.]